MDGRTDGWTYRQTDGQCIDVQTDGCMIRISNYLSVCFLHVDDFRQKSRKSRKDLLNLEDGKTHRLPWQFLNDLIPLRVSNFAFKYVNRDRHAKLNKLWKRAARW